MRMLNKEQRKAVTALMNVDSSIQDEDEAVDVALKIAAEMCKNMDEPIAFYITTDDEDKIKLESCDA